LAASTARHFIEYTFGTQRRRESTPPPVGHEAVERRRRRVQLQVHLGHLVLHHRVVGVRAALDGDRGLARGAVDRQLERAVGDAEVDGRHQRQRPHGHGDHERVGGVAGRDDPADALVGHEHAVEDGVVALGRAHAEGVPVSTTVTPGLVRSTKAWTIWGPAGSATSMAWAPSQRQDGPFEPNCLRPVSR
jgi:hypothetical protein